MKTVFWCLLFMITPIVLIAQEQMGDLSFKAGTWGHNYYVGSQQVSFDVFMSELNTQNAAVGNMFKSGKNLSVVGIVVGSIGSFCFGYDIGTRIAGGKGNTALLIGGGGVMIGGIIMYYVGEGKMKKALTLHKNNSTALYITPTPIGISLCLNF
ncbi:MAG: hypothetical protein FWH23_00105 [Bacteroidales bacterium]|nr:hypothetical protein [Bacteroidales bacterium]